jgi:hypothetical protein
VLCACMYMYVCRRFYLGRLQVTLTMSPQIWPVSAAGDAAGDVAMQSAVLFMDLQQR